VDYECDDYAQYERGSLLRIFRKEFRRHVEYLMSVPGGKLTHAEACTQASMRYDQKGASELMEELLKRDCENVTISELSRLWSVLLKMRKATLRN